MLTAQGLLGDDSIPDEERRKAQQERLQRLYHNTQVLLSHYRDIAWAMECFPEAVAQELEEPFGKLDTLLDRMDRTSMAWGLEARVPFADHRIVEHVYNVPWSMKYENGMEKKLLRDACKDLLPPQLLYRKKSPYPKTYSPVYEALLAERFEQLLANPQAPVHRFMDRKKAAQFLAQPKDYGKPWFGQLMAGPQMIAYFLQVNDWMERYGIS